MNIKIRKNEKRWYQEKEARVEVTDLENEPDEWGGEDCPKIEQRIGKWSICNF